jgi:hypothetical protein
VPDQRQRGARDQDHDDRDSRHVGGGHHDREHHGDQGDQGQKHADLVVVPGDQRPQAGRHLGGIDPLAEHGRGQRVGEPDRHSGQRQAHVRRDCAHDHPGDDVLDRVSVGVGTGLGASGAA